MPQRSGFGSSFTYDVAKHGSGVDMDPVIRSIVSPSTGRIVISSIDVGVLKDIDVSTGVYTDGQPFPANSIGFLSIWRGGAANGGSLKGFNPLDPTGAGFDVLYSSTYDATKYAFTKEFKNGELIVEGGQAIHVISYPVWDGTDSAQVDTRTWLSVNGYEAISAQTVNMKLR